MTIHRTRPFQMILIVLLTAASLATPVKAESGAVSVVFTKGGFIIGLGGGDGVLTFRAVAIPSRCPE